MWNADIEILKDTLKVFHTYSISNSKVENTPIEFCVFDHTLQWTLSCRTPIEQISMPGLNVRGLKFQFVPLKDLSEHIGNDQGFGMFRSIAIY